MEIRGDGNGMGMEKEYSPKREMRTRMRNTLNSGIMMVKYIPINPRYVGVYMCCQFSHHIKVVEIYYLNIKM
jgi:hypothetical protein